MSLMHLLLVLGLVASLMMFAGDMLLYFTTGTYDMDGTLMPYMRIMRDVPASRIKAGGALGPVAAALYVAGFAALLFTARGAYAWLVWIAAALLAFALVCGGAYHAQYAYLSIIAKAGHEDLYDEVSSNIMLIMRLATGPMYLGFVVLGIAIVLGQTVFAPWFVVFTPIATSLLGLVWMRVPQPARCVLFGGWSNLVFTIMFAAMLLFLIAAAA